MATPASLIPELEDAISNGSTARRAEMLRRITSLFIDNANNYSEDHVGVFDDVLVRLIAEIETKTLTELSRRLSPIENAPIQLMRRLAGDDDIQVAGPVLKQSKRLNENDLVDIANKKGSEHLLAISGRGQIGEAVTEVLVRRGDQEVVRNVANNRGAKLSEKSFAALVGRAQRDDVLAEMVGLRPDVPAHLFRQLIAQAAEVVQTRLLVASPPEVQSEIKRVLVEVSREIGTRAASVRDYDAARQTALEMQRKGLLDEKQVAQFAREGQFEQMVAALSVLCAVPLDVVERLLTGNRVDPVLILCRAIGFGWGSVRSIIGARPDAKATSAQKLDDCFSNYERLSPATAQRVVRFWQVRQADAETR
jgi:uncharacterized protein (DUF2336 family)